MQMQMQESMLARTQLQQQQQEQLEKFDELTNQLLMEELQMAMWVIHSGHDASRQFRWFGDGVI